MQEKVETSKNSGNKRESKPNELGEVREGQEDSSILHDKEDPDKELGGSIEKDISSTSQEEFIDDDANTRKESDS